MKGGEQAVGVVAPLGLRGIHLDGLDNAERLARRQRGSHSRELDVDDVAQLALRNGERARVSSTARQTWGSGALQHSAVCLLALAQRTGRAQQRVAE